jgi:hypothetical protein
MSEVKNDSDAYVPQAGFTYIPWATVPRDPVKLYKPLADICEKSAKMNKLDLDLLKEDGSQVLIGITDDGSVLAMSWRSEGWWPSRANIPSALIRSAELGLIKIDGVNPIKPVWVRMDGNRMVVMRDGKEYVIWEAPVVTTPILPTEPVMASPVIPEQKLPRLEDVLLEQKPEDPKDFISFP